MQSLKTEEILKKKIPAVILQGYFEVRQGNGYFYLKVINDGQIK